MGRAAADALNRGEKTSGWCGCTLARSRWHTAGYHNPMVCGTKRDAQRDLNQESSRTRDAGTWVAPIKVTVSAHLDHWLDTIAKHRVRPRTYQGYVDVLNLYVRPTLGQRFLSSLTVVDWQQLVTTFVDQGLSPRTVRYRHAVLHSALKQAVVWRLLTDNPAQYVELPRQARREMHALSPEEARNFLTAASSTRWGILFELAPVTGCEQAHYSRRISTGRTVRRASPGPSYATVASGSSPNQEPPGPNAPSPFHWTPSNG